MTRLETLAHKIYVAAKTEADMRQWISEYLAERDDLVIGEAQTGHNYMTADTARNRQQLEQRGRASEFDNTEVGEVGTEGR